MAKFVVRAYSPRGSLEERVVSGDTAGLINREIAAKTEGKTRTGREGLLQ